MATSAFQFEGNPLEISQRLSDWSQWTTKSGTIADGTTADKACEFFSHYGDDIELCQELNLKAFRISLNWATLCPKATNQCHLDGESLDYYKKLLEALKAHGMTTFVTLFHFCLPRWLSEMGGWNNERTIVAFAKYAELAAQELGDLVDYWLTINEPLVYAYQGYINGLWPPGYHKNYRLAFQAIRGLLEGHAQAYQAIHNISPKAKISFTIHWRPFVARRKVNPLDLISRYYRDYVFNHLFPLAVEKGQLEFPFPLNLSKELQAISGPVAGLKGTMDYLAFNYFTREICEFKFSLPLDILGRQSQIAPLEKTGMGWEIYPEGLYYLLTEDLAPYRFDLKNNARPIFITENGMSTCFPANTTNGDWSLNDDQRVRYLVSHLMAIHESIKAGANVKGYLHWSFLDNFEWSDGLTCRFGLVRVNYTNQERTPRTSAKVYAQIAALNAISPQCIQTPTRLR
ncbi:MAG: glycoside hydrolase family 1 protein [Candidatus Melainabacteria bacterium]|nr:glycoside hydrolase family 1 protein [Candidatus Melainabacteria bacterium]